jgi:predicted metalloprotease
MQWTPGGDSSDIEDRRDEGGGGGGGFGLGPIHLGLGGTVIVGILSLVFHQNLFSLFSGGSSANDPQAQVGSPYAGPANTAPGNSAQDASEQKDKDFVTFIVNDVQSAWTQILPAQTDHQYRHAHLVLYRNETSSACGEAQSATGPFYCPDDEKVYLDLGFFQELSTRFGAPGEFAQAYVIAHEFGHHVQKILGTEAKVRRLQESSPSEHNPLSVRVELQADCYAGVWAHSSQKKDDITQADITAGINAAAAVGDDRLQRMARGTVNPETFTHGSSAQRTHWFQTGLQSGRVEDCNTFGGR